MKRSNMNKMKVMTVVGTRPEIIRLSRTIVKLDRCNKKFAHSGHGSKWAKKNLTEGLPPRPSL